MSVQKSIFSINCIFYIILFQLLFFSSQIYSISSKPVKSKNGMVVSASDIASQVGVEILKNGGNAVDAAVAVGFALAVTYPPAGNIGGGGFMVIHLNDGRELSIDFREKAPFAASRDMYLDDKQNYNPELSREGLTSSGIPGSVAGLLFALEKYGSMQIYDVLQPAIDLAENGFALNKGMAESFNYNKDNFSRYESTKKNFVKENENFKEGEIFKQPDLAETLKQILKNGRDGFYKGKVADLILEQSKKMNGLFTKEDLENYFPLEREVVGGKYRGFDIISMGPPSSGGIALIQLLNIMENKKLDSQDWNSSDYVHTFIEACKYVYADRSVHLGDPDFYKVPLNNLISKYYAEEIFNNIKDIATPSDSIKSGYFPEESKETTHYSVMDSFGNAVSTTVTLNSSYGNSIVVEGAGFFLNNEMDDFSSKPGEPNQFGLLGSEANSIEPGKRMLSSMTPTILLKDGKPYMVIGSPGGSTIITVVFNVIINVIDFGMNIQEAIDMPRIHHQWKPDELIYERFSLSKDVVNNLLLRKHIIGYETELGRAEGIIYDEKEKVFYGATDPRGNGGARGY